MSSNAIVEFRGSKNDGESDMAHGERGVEGGLYEIYIAEL